jgi:hypothetical protein
VDELIQALNFLRQYGAYMNSQAAASGADATTATAGQASASTAGVSASTATSTSAGNAATQMYNQVSAY